MFKRTFLALAAAAVTVTGVAQAQENATLTLRSGEKLTAQLVDLGGGGFAVRVNGADRQIPTNDVAVIDFAGGSMTDADWAKVSEGQQVVQLKSGEMINGQLYDIGGTSPLRITLKTASGERELSSNEINRIILSRPANAVATSGANPNLASATGSGISVNPKQAWTATGLTVRKGEVLTFNATGEVAVERRHERRRHRIRVEVRAQGHQRAASERPCRSVDRANRHQRAAVCHWQRRRGAHAGCGTAVHRHQ